MGASRQRACEGRRKGDGGGTDLEPGDARLALDLGRPQAGVERGFARGPVLDLLAERLGLPERVEQRAHVLRVVVGGGGGGGGRVPVSKQSPSRRAMCGTQTSTHLVALLNQLEPSPKLAEALERAREALLLSRGARRELADRPPDPLGRAHEPRPRGRDVGRQGVGRLLELVLRAGGRYGVSASARTVGERIGTDKKGRGGGGGGSARIPSSSRPSRARPRHTGPSAASAAS